MIVKLNNNTLIIPESIIKKYNLKPNSEFDVSTKGESIVLKFK